jgi:hypothetical protein
MRNNSPVLSFAGWLEKMHSEGYVHPEFGLLSPTPRLRRDLRTALLSLLFGIGIGAAAVIALSGTNNGDETQGPQGVSSRSVSSEEPTETLLRHNSPQAAGPEKRVNKENTSKLDGSTAETNSENRKTDAATTCEGNNSGCPNVPIPAGKPEGTQTPATFGRTSATGSVPSKTASEHSIAGQDQAGGAPESNPLTHKKSSETARNPQPRQHAPNYREDRAAISRRYDKPVGKLGRAYSLDRSRGQTGFWDWSR